MKKNIIYTLCVLSLVLPTLAMADIYKCTGDDSTPTFADANTKANYKNCRLIIRDNGSQVSTNATKTTSPENFPKVDAHTQNQRDDKRKEILLSELNTEQKALDTAQNLHSQSEIQMHQKNIQLLQKEVSALK